MDPVELKKILELLNQHAEPETVGLRRILHAKKEKLPEFPLHEPDFEQYGSAQLNPVSFNEDEREILRLQKELVEVKASLREEKKKKEEYLTAAFEEGKKEEGKKL